jgi:hypothetical protein
MSNFHVNRKLTAFDDKTVGTKVTDAETFNSILSGVIDRGVDFPTEGDFKGTTVVQLTAEALATVSAGAGKRTDNPEDYIHVLYRGNVESFLKRRCAEPGDAVRVLLYHADRYAEDSQVSDEEKAEVAASGVSVVLVAIWFGEGAVSDRRMLVNATGGNLAFDAMSKEDMVLKFKEHLASDYMAVADA